MKNLYFSADTCDGGRIVLHEKDGVCLLHYQGEIVWRSTDKKPEPDNLVVNITCDTSDAMRKIEELRKEIASLSASVVELPHNHPLPEGFTAHDGSYWPSGLLFSDRVIVQFGDGQVENGKNSSCVNFWYNKDPHRNNWYWCDGYPGRNDIIAYKVVS